METQAQSKRDAASLDWDEGGDQAIDDQLVKDLEDLDNVRQNAVDEVRTIETIVELEVTTSQHDAQRRLLQEEIKTCTQQFQEA